MHFWDFSWQSTLFRDLWSKETRSFSSLSALLDWFLSFSSLSAWLDWFFSFSGLSVLCLGFSLLSVLFLETSKTSVLFRGCSNWSVLLLEVYLWEGGFSTVDMNFFRCLIYSGNCSRSQWLPPLSQSGSYFSLHSSQSCLPWEQSTTSSEVPYTLVRVLKYSTSRFFYESCNQLQNAYRTYTLSLLLQTKAIGMRNRPFMGSRWIIFSHNIRLGVHIII